MNATWVGMLSSVVSNEHGGLRNIMELVLVDMGTMSTDDVDAFTVNWLPNINDDEHLMLVMQIAINARSYKIMDCMLQKRPFGLNDFEQRSSLLTSNDVIKIEHLAYNNKMSGKVAVFSARLQSYLTHQSLLEIVCVMPKKIRAEMLPFVLE